MGCRNHLYRYSSDLYRYRFDSVGLNRYRSRLYRYNLATVSPIPVQVQRCTGTGLRIYPETLLCLGGEVWYISYLISSFSILPECVFELK